MGVQLTKDSIDLGIIVEDAERSLKFYRDTLGFELQAVIPSGNGTMYRLGCGTSVIKLVQPATIPAVKAPPGGPGGATGYRYWTISISNLEEMVAACERAGYRVTVPPRDARPGVRIAMVEDPDGNWVEFGVYS